MRGVGRWVELLLQDRVEIFAADQAPFHRREHLDIVEAMETMRFGQAVRDEIEDDLHDIFRIFRFDELKISSGIIGNIGEFPLVDPVGIGDDQRTRSLAEDLF